MKIGPGARQTAPIRQKSLPAVVPWLAMLVLGTATVSAGEAGKKTHEEKPADKSELRPLNKNGSVLLDLAGGRLLLKTQVVQREGLLELLCCLKQTKEHEAILSLDAKAYVVHAGLLALGARSGTPVTYQPDYRPPTGQKIDIFVNWTDAEGKPQRAQARTWVRHATRRFWATPLARLPTGLVLPANTELRYDDKLKELSWYGAMSATERDRFLALSSAGPYRKAIWFFFDQTQSREMQADWVFAGSGFFTDEDTGQKFYLAEEGDLICVANFPGATIDVAVRSSSQGDPTSPAGEGLLFEAYTERIPPHGTPVTIELIPVVEKKAKPQALGQP